MAEEQNIAHLIEEFKKQAKDQAETLSDQQRKLERQRKEDIARDVFSTKMALFNTFISKQRHKLSKDLQARGIRTEKATEERDTKGSIYNREQARKGPSGWQTSMLDTTAGFAPKVIEEAGNVKALTKWNLEGGLTESIQKGFSGTILFTEEKINALADPLEHLKKTATEEKDVLDDILERGGLLDDVAAKETAKEKEKGNEERRERKSMMDVLKGIGGGMKKFAANMGRKAVGGLKAMFAGLAAVLGLGAWLLFVDSPAWHTLIQKIKFELVPFLKALPGKIDQMWGDFMAWWDDPAGGQGLIQEFKDARTAFISLKDWISNTSTWMTSFVNAAVAEEAARAEATGETPRTKPEAIATAIVAATAGAIGNYIKDNKEGWKTAILESLGLSTWDDLIGKIALTGAGLAIGTKIGMKAGFAMGPLGIIVGGIIGALVGGFVGYYQGQNIVKAGAVVATALGNFFSIRKSGANWGALFGISLAGIALALAAPFTGGLSFVGFLAIMTTGAAFGAVAGSLADAKFNEAEKDRLRKSYEYQMRLGQQSLGTRWLEYVKSFLLWKPFAGGMPGNQAAERWWDQGGSWDFEDTKQKSSMGGDTSQFHSDFILWQMNTRNTAIQKMNEFKTGWNTFWTNTGNMISKISPFSAETIQSDDADDFRVKYLAFFADIRENWKSWFAKSLLVLIGLSPLTPKTPDPKEADTFRETWVGWLFRRIKEDTITQLKALGDLVMLFINPPTGKEIMDSLPLIVRDPLEWFINLFKPFRDVETEIGKKAEEEMARRKIRDLEKEQRQSARTWQNDWLMNFIVHERKKQEGKAKTELDKIQTVPDLLEWIAAGNKPKTVAGINALNMIQTLAAREVAIVEELKEAQLELVSILEKNSKPGNSLLTHDSGLHKLIKEGNDMWKNSIILQQAYGGGGTTIINNNYNTTSVVAPTTSNRSNVKVEAGNSVFDPHTRVYGLDY